MIYVTNKIVSVNAKITNVIDVILGRQMHDIMHNFTCYLAKYEYLAVEDFEND